MKKSQLLASFGLILASCGSLLAADQDCEKTAKAVKAAITEEPEKILMIVDESVAKHEECACEIVKSAIEVSKEDKALTARIVAAAVYAATEKAAIIAECAIAAHPEAAGEIKAALKEVFEGAKSGTASGKQVVSGKEVVSGKGVVVDESPDHEAENRVVSGVYMIAPVAPSGTGEVQIKEVIKVRSITRQISRRTTPPPQSP